MVCSKLAAICVGVLCFAGFFVGSAAAATVGVYPSAHDLGTVERGTVMSVDMLLVGGNGGEHVTLEPVRPLQPDFSERARPYDFAAVNASQEDTRNWVEVLDDEITLGEERRIQLGGRQVTGNSRASFLLHVPKDAEPGYHLVVLRPAPSTADGKGMGVGTNAVARHKVAFRVPGEAVRGAKILGFNAERVSEHAVEVLTVVQNTGTVTETVRVRPAVIVNGTQITLGQSGARLGPGQIETFRSRWNVDDVPIGTYDVNATASWITGNTTKQGSIPVNAYTAPVGKSVSTETDDGRRFPAPLSILSTILVLFAVYQVWRRRTTDTDSR